MNIKKLALFLSALLVSCVFCNNSFAQSQTRSRAIYGELLGASQGIGFNYDARFKKDASDGFGWRTGLGFGYAYSSIFAAYNIDGEKIDYLSQSRSTTSSVRENPSSRQVPEPLCVPTFTLLPPVRNLRAVSEQSPISVWDIAL